MRFEVGDVIVDSGGVEGVITGVDHKSRRPYRVAFNVGEDGELRDCSGEDFILVKNANSAKKVMLNFRLEKRGCDSVLLASCEKLDKTIEVSSFKGDPHLYLVKDIISVFVTGAEVGMSMMKLSDKNEEIEIEVKYG